MNTFTEQPHVVKPPRPKFSWCDGCGELASDVSYFLGRGWLCLSCREKVRQAVGILRALIAKEGPRAGDVEVHFNEARRLVKRLEYALSQSFPGFDREPR